MQDKSSYIPPLLKVLKWLTLLFCVRCQLLVKATVTEDLTLPTLTSSHYPSFPFTHHFPAILPCFCSLEHVCPFQSVVLLFPQPLLLLPISPYIFLLLNSYFQCFYSFLIISHPNNNFSFLTKVFIFTISLCPAVLPFFLNHKCSFWNISNTRFLTFLIIASFTVEKAYALFSGYYSKIK